VRDMDDKGMAVIMDALIFLVVLVLICAMITTSVPLEGEGSEDGTVRSFHTVMLEGEMYCDDGSALSHTTISEYLRLSLGAGQGMDDATRSILDAAISPGLSELSGMGWRAWWTVTVDGMETTFGQIYHCDTIYADQRSLGNGLTCTLFIA